ncbi:hypothetical protein FCL38_04510 [Pseudoduganella umbonata]|uniref:Uncharacterized protein n=1 Tax=Pseudoduganella umbonata TaxID=864828 RepID=A0ABX5URV0_9BURK|nr:hypothetical protein FCL38_04510 [Pseudoduganella umbonata]
MPPKFVLAGRQVCELGGEGIDAFCFHDFSVSLEGDQTSDYTLRGFARRRRRAGWDRRAKVAARSRRQAPSSARFPGDPLAHVQDSVKTVWCAQHDPFTCAPATGHSFESPSKGGQKSVLVIAFLMSRLRPRRWQPSQRLAWRGTGEAVRMADIAFEPRSTRRPAPTLSCTGPAPRPGTASTTGTPIPASSAAASLPATAGCRQAVRDHEDWRREPLHIPLGWRLRDAYLRLCRQARY